MDIDGLAMVNCFANQSRARQCNGQTTAMLNVGHTITNLVVINDDKPPFIRDILHGGKRDNRAYRCAAQLTREAACGR